MPRHATIAHARAQSQSQEHNADMSDVQSIGCFVHFRVHSDRPVLLTQFLTENTVVDYAGHRGILGRAWECFTCGVSGNPSEIGPTIVQWYFASDTDRNTYCRRLPCNVSSIAVS